MGDTAAALFQHSARFITLFDSLDGGFSSKAKTHPAARAGPRGRKGGNEGPGAAERTASRRGEKTRHRKRLAGLLRRQPCAPHGRVGSGRLVPAAGGRGGRGAPASGLGWGGGAGQIAAAAGGHRDERRPFALQVGRAPAGRGIQGWQGR